MSKIIEQVCQRILPVNLEVSAALFAYNWEVKSTFNMALILNYRKRLEQIPSLFVLYQKEEQQKILQCTGTQTIS